MTAAGGGFSQETKYSAEQGFHGGAEAQAQPPSSSGTPPSSAAAASSAAYHAPGADFLNRYKLEQTIRQLHGIHSADPRSSFGAPFSGV